MRMETDHVELQIYVFSFGKPRKDVHTRNLFEKNIPLTTVWRLSEKIPIWWVDERYCSMRCTPGAFVLHILKLFVNDFLHDRDSAGKMLGAVSCLSPAHTGSLGISAASKDLEITVALHQSPELLWSMFGIGSSTVKSQHPPAMAIHGQYRTHSNSQPLLGER